MQKQGDLKKRRLLTLILVLLVVFAKITPMITNAEEEEVIKIRIKEEEKEEEDSSNQFLSIVQEEKLIAKIEEKLSSIDSQINILINSYGEESESIKDEVTSEIKGVERILKDYPNLEFLEEVSSRKDTLMAYSSAIEKISDIEISSDMDMSEMVGLSEEEIKIILLRTRDKKGNHLLEDEKLAGELADLIYRGTSQYNVNELFVISVMIWETGWLQESPLEKNNFGGLKQEEELLAFDSIEEGMLSTIKSIKSNMKGNNTAREINLTYCFMENEEDFSWADNIICIMRDNVAAKGTD